MAPIEREEEQCVVCVRFDDYANLSVNEAAAGFFPEISTLAGSSEMCIINRFMQLK